MIANIVANLWITALFALYWFSDSPGRDVLLAAAVVVAIGNAAERITDKL